jgi:hypothetical protein
VSRCRYGFESHSGCDHGCGYDYGHGCDSCRLSAQERALHVLRALVHPAHVPTAVGPIVPSPTVDVPTGHALSNVHAPYLNRSCDASSLAKALVAAVALEEIGAASVRPAEVHVPEAFARDHADRCRATLQVAAEQSCCAGDHGDVAILDVAVVVFADVISAAAMALHPSSFAAPYGKGMAHWTSRTYVRK